MSLGLELAISFISYYGALYVHFYTRPLIINRLILTKTHQNPPTNIYSLGQLDALLR